MPPWRHWRWPPARSRISRARAPARAPANVGKSTSFTVGETGSATGAAALYPDASIGTGNIQTHSYKVANPGAGSQKLGKVVISVANGDGSTWSHGSCTANDFSIGGQAVGQPWTDTSLQGNYKAGEAKTGTVTVQMIDNGQNQDDCQGVTVPLYFSAS